MHTRREFLVAAGSAAVLSMDLLQEASAKDASGKVAPFGEALTISGKPRERGLQYGRHFATAIREFLDREIYAAFSPKSYLKDDLLRYAGACFGVIREECPEIGDELEGMAEGTALRVEEHVLLTLHEELYHRGVLPPVPHCTAVAVGPPETPDKSTYVGQTWDWMQSVAGLSTMLTWQRDEGPSILAYAFPGLWVGAGLNANGLALCWTSAELGKKNQTPRIGLPSYVLLTHLLYQPSLDAVIEAAKRNRHAGWFTFVLGSGDGRLLNIEGSPEKVTVEETRSRLIRIGFGTRRMTGTPADQAVARHPRCTAMDTLLDKTAGQTDLSAMQQHFGDPQRGICVGPGTIDMMLFDTTRRTAHLSRGPDYGVAWKTFGFPT